MKKVIATLIIGVCLAVGAIGCQGNDTGKKSRRPGGPGQHAGGPERRTPVTTLRRNGMDSTVDGKDDMRSNAGLDRMTAITARICDQ